MEGLDMDNVVALRRELARVKSLYEAQVKYSQARITEKGQVEAELARARAEASLLRDELRASQQHTTKLIAVVERQGEVVQGLVARLGTPQQPQARCPSCGASSDYVECTGCHYKYRPT